MPAVSPYFRRKLGRPKYPGLWEGCIGAWCPSALGCTGLTTLYDLSGVNHGTMNGFSSTAWEVAGSGPVLTFSGSQWVDLPHAITRTLNGAPGATLHCWFKGSAPNSLIRLQPQDSHYLILYRAASGGALANFPSTPNVVLSYSIPNDGAFHAATLVYAPGTNGYRVFVDGILAASATVSGAVTFTGSETYFSAIGRYGALTGFEFATGNVDDARIYRRVLTDSEIRLLARRRGIAYETLPPAVHTDVATNLLDARRRAVVC